MTGGRKLRTRDQKSCETVRNWDPCEIYLGTPIRFCGVRRSLRALSPVSIINENCQTMSNTKMTSPTPAHATHTRLSATKNLNPASDVFGRRVAFLSQAGSGKTQLEHDSMDLPHLRLIYHNRYRHVARSLLHSSFLEAIGNVLDIATPFN
jgi:hypothetical protein